MLELGCDAEALHFSVGISAFKNGVTDLYCIGKLSEKIAEGAVFAGMPRERIRFFGAEEKERLISVLLSDLAKGDALLLKASRAIKLEDVLTALTEP
jgi:UDP-N-acetylmuramoyl-tripeptide--D-alanyl-D-alanine ligase